MSINKAWHEKNKMPKDPKPDERMKWHIAHLKYCECYPVSEKLRKELEDFKKKK
ncbi:MAG: hypothetical protein RL681_178 [Candidatus Parcubacteria bacterium]